MLSEIDYLYDAPLIWKSGNETITLSPFSILESNCVQYCQRMPAGTAASVHYSVEPFLKDGTVTGFRVALHTEYETADGDADARKRLIADLRPEFWRRQKEWYQKHPTSGCRFTMGKSWSWLDLHSIDIIPSGLSKEDFRERVTDLLSELYELTEDFLEKAERSKIYNPYGWDEVEEGAEQKTPGLDLSEPEMDEPTEDADLWQGMSHACVLSAARLLKMNLRIPPYQRPYKWERKNVLELLRDTEDAIESAESATGADTYRLGTVIVHQDKDEQGKDVYNVVDGQQRLLTLSLLLFCLNSAPKDTMDVPLLGNQDTLDHLSRQPESPKRLHDNYEAIRDYLGNRVDLKQKFFDALYKVLQVVVVKVDKEDEAFQLFDSQNTRGRPLDPHDLLKAYHLRAMQIDGASDWQMKRRVTGWEAVPPETIRSLFDSYLFRVYNWARGQKTHAFTARDIAAFKGLTLNRHRHLFPFVRRAVATGHEFQIGADFQAGEAFFALVEHYLDLRDELAERLDWENAPAINSDYNKTARRVDKVMKCPRLPGGFRHLHGLFLCALFCYADRFGFENLDARVLAKLCRWAYSVMLDRDRMSERTVNRYAIGLPGYTNAIAMFAVIQEALTPSEIVGQSVAIPERTGPLARRLKELETKA